MTGGARPYVLLSVAVSVDGHVDDASPDRLVLSNRDDLDRVDEVRAGVDAILVGAGTVRADAPRLLVRSPERRSRRMAEGRAPDPLKVALTATGDLDPGSPFFTAGETGAAGKIVYCAGPAVGEARARVGEVATVVDGGDPVDPAGVLADLAGRGVDRLMVEGGTAISTLLLAAGLVDELHLAVAPFFVGDPGAPRFVAGGPFPPGPDRPMVLADVRALGDVVVLRYLLGDRTTG